MSRLVVGAVAALSLALAGCSGDPKAEPSPSPSPSATSPVATTPTAPVMPEAAKANTKAGAVAFVRHYLEVINYAQATGDVGPLDSIEDPGCESCQNIRNYLGDIYSNGGAIAGGRWLVEHAEASAGPEGTWIVEVKGRFAPSTVTPSQGASPRSAKGGPAPTTFELAYDTRWVVKRWTRGI